MSDQAKTMDGYDALRELALDLRWSWNHASDVVWRKLDADLWEAAQNPWNILQTVSRDKIHSLLAEPTFSRTVHELLAEKQTVEQSPAWFQLTHPTTSLRTVAYFCMEFMLSEALPIYSGGLGNVAGDQLKAASDLGVPVVGVGLLYAQGYFRQVIGADGGQEALYPVNEPGQLPLRPLREADGEWLRLQLDFPGGKLWIRTWEVQVGRAKLYLLDTNDPANRPAQRCITSELYGGGPELRLKQEIVLGIGGWKLLRAIGLDPQVCHLNEGHAAFAALERARDFRIKNVSSFADALMATRAGNIFTTHTAVEAGFDRFAPDLMEKYFRSYAEAELEIPIDQLLALGRRDADDRTEPFTMAYLAIRASGAVNAVSALHEQVSKQIFQPLFPRWPAVEVPVGHVTNGIHVPTWDSAAADDLWTQAAGKDRWLGDLTGLETSMRRVSSPQLWRLRSEARQLLVEEVRKQYFRQLAEDGALEENPEGPNSIFDVNVLTLGFARRFATYKRPNLLLHDPERLVRMLIHGERPVQLILAGKAHPQDVGGQVLIRQWNDFSKRLDIRSRVIFLRDYDMLQSQRLVQGVDVWINTPLRPWEASGTSGMKILANGGLNVSELDGWWAEAYSADVGWAIGDGKEHGGDPAVDAAEAEELYRLLEQEVIPEFYRRGEDGIPSTWVARIRESIARLTPRFSANRAVREYTENFYLPAATAYLARGEAAGDLGKWKDELSKHWQNVHFGTLRTNISEDTILFTVEVYLGGLAPQMIEVELCAESKNGGALFKERMRKQGELPGSGGGHLYVVSVPHTRQASDFTPRIVPVHTLAHIPLEVANIIWQR